MSEPKITLAALGWDAEWEKAFAGLQSKGLEPARVAVEDKHHYEVMTPGGLFLAQVPGKMLHHARNNASLPKVGDWAAVQCVPATGRATLHTVLPRRNQLSRKVPGRESEEHVLVTNVDVAFIVQSLDRPFNARLLERFLTMVIESRARPVIVLNKADLEPEPGRGAAEAAAVAGGALVLSLSARTGRGMPALRQCLGVGRSTVFLGPSGVGKSSLINRIYGEEILATTEVRECDSRGRHTTTWRELIVLPKGGIVIDTPGLREFHVWTTTAGMLEAFQDLEDLALQCRFRNCTHTTEKYCVVRAELEAGRIARERFDNYVRIRQEALFLDQSRQRWTQPKARHGAQVGGRQPRKTGAKGPG